MGNSEGRCLALSTGAGKGGERTRFDLATGKQGITRKSSGNHEKEWIANQVEKSALQYDIFLEHKKVQRLQETKGWRNSLTDTVFWSIKLNSVKRSCQKRSRTKVNDKRPYHLDFFS